MVQLGVRSVSAVMFLALLVSGFDAAEDNLVRNADFRKSDRNALPADWTVWGPDNASARCQVRTCPGGLLIDAPREPWASGGVWQDVGGIQRKGAYSVEAVVRAKEFESPFRSLLVRVGWLQGGKAIHPAGAYVNGPFAAGGSLPWVGHWRTIGPRDRMPETYGPLKDSR